MLKASPSAAARSCGPASTSRNLLLDSSHQALANPPPPSGLADQWNAFVNGNAKADDAQMLQKRREEEVAFAKARWTATPQPAAAVPVTVYSGSGPGQLIETSPRKPAATAFGKPVLLVDLDINAECSSYASRPPVSLMQRKKTTCGSSEVNLMD